VRHIRSFRPRRAVGVVIVSLLAAAAAMVPSAAMADQQYTDPTGDANGAIDVGAVNVVNDNAGNIGFTLLLPGVTELPADGVVELDIDTDQNANTGDKNGAEVIIVVDSTGYDYARWDGTTMNYDTQSPTTTVRLGNGVLAIGINKSDLNNSSALAFWIYGDKYAADNTIAAEDAAPDGSDVWTYAFATKAVKLQLAKPTTRPALPVAGHRFSVSTAVTQAPGSTPVTGAKVQCVVRVGIKLVAARGTFAGGVARCDLTLPAKSTGKTLRGTIAVVVTGGKSTKSFAFKVL
jgi:hypothetical protein